MRREAFGSLAALNDADLARALVAIGASSFRLAEAMSIDALVERYPRAFRRQEQRTGETILDFTIPVAALQRYAIRADRLKNGAESLLQWQTLFQGTCPPPTRYCLDLNGLRNDPDRQIDLDWLTALLGHESVNPDSVFAAWPLEPLSLEWEWPLRIGIAPGPSSAGFRELVDRSVYLDRGLFTVVDVESATARCDVLMFPSSLRDATRSALELPSVRASAVLVLGGLDVPWALARPWLSGLRHQFHSGAVGSCFVPSIERGAWLQRFIEELSHNVTLDRALFHASSLHLRQSSWYPKVGSVLGRLTPPLILADRDFLDSTRVAETAKRIGAAAATATNMVVQMPRLWNTEAYKSSLQKFRNYGAAVAWLAENLSWHQEGGDATALKEFRGAVELVTGTALVLPSIVVGLAARRAIVRSPRYTVGALEALRSEAKEFAGKLQEEARKLVGSKERQTKGPSKQVAGKTQKSAGDVKEGAYPRLVGGVLDQRPRIEQRRVQLNVFRAGDNTRQSKLEPVTPYRTSVFIGAARKRAVKADAILDENLLPPSSTGHQIKIVFTPLWKDAEGLIPSAQVQEVHLPSSGTSGRAQFYFTTPRDLTDFRARVVLLNEYRVLQTLFLCCAQKSAQPIRKLILMEENIVSADYGNTTVAPPFEAALIVNDSPHGVMGLTAISGEGVQFFEPAGFDEVLEMIRDDLGSLNTQDDAAGQAIIGLDDERVHELMYRLALRGASLAKELRRQPHLGGFLSAPRLQVVDAVSGAFFPVELVYEGKPPAIGAKRCEWSIDALRKQSVHEECPNRESSEHICPAAFWGFSKCIERQPSRGQQGYRFSQPTQSNNALRPLKSVLFAASKKVRPEDIEPPVGLESVFIQAKMGFDQAITWSDWTSKIENDAPSMLVLLPHSFNSVLCADLPALEIGGDEMPSVRMDETFVHGRTTERPVVLLLGCSTSLPDIPFLSFVREFRYNGAVVIVGTLATIRGRQTVEFVKEFLKQLRRVAEEDLTFDEAILRVKRRMLAKGDPFVLSLVAYGDTGWRVRI